jgi:putative nucleotidyltransferase with HDIG domain
VHEEAVKTAGDILSNVRIGKQISVKRAVSAVTNIINGILGDDDTLLSLCRIKQRDKYTFQHSVSVSALLVNFCHSLGGFSKDDLLQAGLGGLFHDVGKMKIPDDILNKPGSLTDPEFEIMRTHVIEGLDYLRSDTDVSEIALRIVAEHHERYDGSGYPKGLSQNYISYFGRMAAIVEVYDAITSERVYHSALEPSEALKRMFEWGGKHFDETMMHQFIRTMGIYPVGSLVRLKSGCLAVVLRQGELNLLQPIVRIVYNAKRGHRLPPGDLDLASPNCQDQIVGFEVPGSWGIDTIKYIASEIQ